MSRVLLQGSAVVGTTFSGKCWRIFTTCSHCKGTAACSWMDQTQRCVRHSWCMRMPNPVLNEYHRQQLVLALILGSLA